MSRTSYESNSSDRGASRLTPRRLGAGVVASLVVLLGANLHDRLSDSPAKTDKSEQALAQALRDPQTRAELQASGVMTPLGGGDVLQVKLHDDKGKEEVRLVHLVMPDETAEGLAQRFHVPEQSSYIQQQGSGEGHELMKADLVFLPPDAVVESK